MKRILAVSLLVLCLFSLLKAEKIPFGIQIGGSGVNTISGQALDSLKNKLGINVLYATSYEGDIPYSRIEALHDSGFAVIPYMTTDSGNRDTTIAFQTYLRSHYIIIGAGDDTTGVRFYTRHGNRDGSDANWYVSSLTDTDSLFLDDLCYQHEWNFYGENVDYQPFLYIRLYGDSTTHDSVAIFNVFKTNTQYWLGPYYSHDSLVVSDTIWADDFSYGRLDTIVLKDFQNLNACNWCGDNLIYQIKTTHARSFAIQWLKVYNENGRRLMEDTTQNAIFREYARAHTDVFAWQLRDDMKTDEMMPAHRVDSLISAGTSGAKRGMMKYADGFIKTPEDLVRIAQPKYFWDDPYHFYGGGAGWITTLYYGSGADDETWGLQFALNHLIDLYLAPTRIAAGDSVEYWHMAQMQAEEVAEAPGTFTHRWPTAPEMRCEASLTMSFGVDAIQYWPYFTQGEANGNIDHGLYGNPYYTVDTTVWNKIARYVTPNLQALDEYLADPNMIWEKSYSSHQPDSFHYISSIYGWSDSPNPDVGWAQIGEFHNGTDKYIMLVNRACSQGQYDSSEAPPITAIVQFNQDNLGLGNSVFIIDLAHTQSYNSLTHHWDPVPETTYSTGNPLIPFTTTLKAGEGRLLKIAQSPKDDILQTTR